MVTLVDQLARIARHAESLEISVEALSGADWACIEERKTALEGAIAASRVRLGGEMIAARSSLESEWVWDKVDISERFDALKRARNAHHSQGIMHGTASAGDAAEHLASDEIDFALYVIEEAEYAILAAISASVAAALTAALSSNSSLAANDATVTSPLLRKLSAGTDSPTTPRPL